MPTVTCLYVCLFFILSTYSSRRLNLLSVLNLTTLTQYSTLWVFVSLFNLILFFLYTVYIYIL